MPTDIRDAILALLGNAAILGAVAYWIKSRADARLKELEIRLEETKGGEEQETKRQESFDHIIELFGDTLREMRAAEKRHSQNYEETEKRREDDFLATKELYIQTGAEFRQAILDIRREMHDLLADTRKGFQQDLEAVMLRAQTMYASRDVFETFHLGFSFPDEYDPRFQLCKVIIAGDKARNIYRLPAMADKNQLATLNSGETAWIITDKRSGFDGWGIIRPVNMPETVGFILMLGLTLEGCKRLERTPPNGLPPLTAVVPAPG